MQVICTRDSTKVLKASLCLTQVGTLTTPIVIHPNSPVPVQAHSRQIDRGISISLANFKMALVIIHLRRWQIFTIFDP